MSAGIDGRHARVVVPTAVEPEDSAVGLSHPNQLRDGVGQCVKLPLACPKCRFDAFAFGNLFGCDVDSHNLAIWTPYRMPVRNPRAMFVLITALPCYLDPGHRLAACHDGPNDRFDRFGQCRYALSHRSSQMPFNGNAANFGEMLVNLQIA